MDVFYMIPLSLDVVYEMLKREHTANRHVSIFHLTYKRNQMQWSCECTVPH
jgi:hypothetical protein